MDDKDFMCALIGGGRNSRIPIDEDWFAPLIGDWDCDYTETNSGRHVDGEWMFRRALDGMGILDVFIFPSRDWRFLIPEPDAEYGCAIRMYRAERHCYEMSYTCADFSIQLEIKKEDDKIVCTPKDIPNERWAFSNITKDSFHWENSKILEDGTWKPQCEVNARRRK